MSFLKTTRLALGLSQHGLAEILGISRSHLALAELGDREIPDEALLRLAKLKNVGTKIDNSSADNPFITVRQEEYLQELEKKIELENKSLLLAEEKLNYLSKKHSGACVSLVLIEEEKKMFGSLSSYGSQLEEKYEAQKQLWMATHPVVGDEVKLSIRIIQSKLEIYRAEVERIRTALKNDHPSQ